MSDQANSISLTIGGETKVVGLAVAGKLFVFSPVQMQFLLNLQKLKNAAAAALSIDRTEDWGAAFLRSRKFREYLSCKMQEFSVKNGLTVEWWYDFGRCVTEGYREYYEIACEKCGYGGGMTTYEVEAFRGDDMGLSVNCPACFEKDVKIEKKRDEFKPSREQVEGWKELGQRLIPKVERVHHQFENVNIEFENEGEKQHG